MSLSDGSGTSPRLDIRDCDRSGPIMCLTEHVGSEKCVTTL